MKRFAVTCFIVFSGLVAVKPAVAGDCNACFPGKLQCQSRCDPDDPGHFQFCMNNCETAFKWCLRGCSSGQQPGPILPGPITPMPVQPSPVDSSLDQKGVVGQRDYTFTAPVNGFFFIYIAGLTSDIDVVIGKLRHKPIEGPNLTGIKAPSGTIRYPIQGGIEYRYTLTPHDGTPYELHTSASAQRKRRL